jgi:YD repeat-containing protein
MRKICATGVFAASALGLLFNHAGAQTHSYDAIGRLILSTQTNGQSTTYAYDRNGNLEAVGSVAPGADSDGDGLPDYFEIRFTGQSTALLPNTDSESDGLSAFQEFAFGRDPRRSDNGRLTVVSLITPHSGTGQLALTYLRPRGGTLLIDYIPQVSQDLVTWSSAASDVQEVSAIAQPDGLELVTVRASVTSVTAPRVFLRIRLIKR